VKKKKTMVLASVAACVKIPALPPKLDDPVD